jgi:hypothetical protein
MVLLISLARFFENLHAALAEAAEARRLAAKKYRYVSEE